MGRGKPERIGEKILAALKQQTSIAGEGTVMHGQTAEASKTKQGGAFSQASSSENLSTGFGAKPSQASKAT